MVKVNDIGLAFKEVSANFIKTLTILLESNGRDLVKSTSPKNSRGS